MLKTFYAVVSASVMSFSCTSTPKQDETAATAAVVTPPAAPTPIEIVDTMESKGVSPGHRRNHAKGLCVEGEFRPHKQAKDLSASEIFAGSPVKVVGRFSNPGGNPHSADNGTAPRGFALQFQGKSGGISNMAMLNVPIFPVPTPEGFLELLKANSPKDIAAFRQKYPRSAPFFEFLAKNGVPQSYTTVDYHSLHAFKFTNTKGEAIHVRWDFISQQGNRYLSAEEAKKKSPNFLADALQASLKQGQATWKMQASIANPGDSLEDPSMPWQGPHKTVELGLLKLKKADSTGTGACDDIIFDPNNLAQGIEATNDPVLKIRSPAYALSFGRRFGEKSQGKQK